MDGRTAPRTAAMDTFRWGLGVGDRRYENGNTTTNLSISLDTTE